jgi:ParB/RepB/Spo0J family partition protein
MEHQGQLQPVIVRKDKSVYELIDGFKRYYAAKELKWESLIGQIVELDEIGSLTMILRYNQHGRGLLNYEEAKIVYSLNNEHGISQEDIAQLLSRSHSWVSRRLSFIGRLSQSVQQQLRMGTISPSQARELIKLPRGKQEEFVKLIIQHRLTSRQSAILVREYLKSQTEEQQQYLLMNPHEILSRVEEHAIYDSRMGEKGNRLLKSARLLSNQQHIFIGYSTHPPIEELSEIEKDILSERFIDIIKKAKKIESILKPYYNEE